MRDFFNRIRGTKTFKAIAAMELAAIAIFVQGVLAGTQHLDLSSLEGWLFFQALMIGLVCLRDAIAKVGAVDPAIINDLRRQWLEDTANRLDADHPLAAKALRQGESATLPVEPADETDPNKGG